MTDIASDDSLLEQFACPVCFEYMDKKIYICVNGHSICGVCKSKITKCPVCNVMMTDSKRNISLEQAAKQVKAWKARQEAREKISKEKASQEKIFKGKVSNENISKGKVSKEKVSKEKVSKEKVSKVGTKLTRKTRLSLGSPLKIEPEDYLVENQIQCPFPKCCYFTKHLLQLKMHMQTWHPNELYAIKKMVPEQSEKSIRVRIYWDLNSVYSMYVLTSAETFFIVYVMKTSKSVTNPSYSISVLTVNDKTKMYKFTCGTTSKFSMFYQGRHQAQEGIEVDCSVIETVNKDTCPKYLVQLYISRIAALHDEGNG